MQDKCGNAEAPDTPTWIIKPVVRILSTSRTTQGR